MNAKSVLKFLDEFKMAINSHKSQNIVACYDFPFLYLSDHSKNVYTQPSELANLFSQMIEQYVHYNIHSADYEVTAFNALTEQLVEVSVKWTYFYPNGKKIFDSDFHYNLKTDQNGNLKINTLISVNEHLKIQKLITHAA